MLVPRPWTQGAFVAGGYGQTVDVVDSKTSTSNGDFVTSSPGTWRWKASYLGDDEPALDERLRHRAVHDRERLARGRGERLGR